MNIFKYPNYEGTRPIHKLETTEYSIEDLGLDKLVFENGEVTLRHGTEICTAPSESTISGIKATREMQIIENQFDEFNYKEIIIPVLRIKGNIRGAYNGTIEALVKPKLLKDFTSAKISDRNHNDAPNLAHNQMYPVPIKPVTLEKRNSQPLFKHELSPDLYFCILSTSGMLVGRKSQISDDYQQMLCSIAPAYASKIHDEPVDLNKLDSKSFGGLCIFYAGRIQSERY